MEEALELKRSGRLDEAVIALEGALARSPSNAVALAHLADVQLRRRRLADAADALERAEALAGTTAFTARVRGDLRYREQRWRDAARCYADADVLTKLKYEKGRPGEKPGAPSPNLPLSATDYCTEKTAAPLPDAALVLAVPAARQVPVGLLRLSL